MNIIIAGALHADKSYEEKLLVKLLEKKLKQIGYTVDSFFLPFGEDSKTIVNEIMAFRMVDVSLCDLLITVGYPACFIEHKNKKIILFDTYPQLFEYLGTQYGYEDSEENSSIKDLITNMEKIIFQRSDIICFSEILKKDILNRYGIQSQVIKLKIEENYFDEVIKKVNIDSINYYIINTDLSEEDRIYDKVLNQLESDSTIKILLCISRSSATNIKKVRDYIFERKIEQNIILVEGSVSNNILKDSIGYIYTGYNRRKISWELLRAIQNNVKVYTFDENIIEEFQNYKDNFIKINNLNNVKDSENVECVMYNTVENTLEEFLSILVQE